MTSPVAKSATDSLKTTVKLIGEELVGSDCAMAWSIVTVGWTVSIVTFDDAEGTDWLPPASVAVAVMAWGLPLLSLNTLV